MSGFSEALTRVGDFINQFGFVLGIAIWAIIGAMFFFGLRCIVNSKREDWLGSLGGGLLFFASMCLGYAMWMLSSFLKG